MFRCDLKLRSEGIDVKSDNKIFQLLIASGKNVLLYLSVALYRAGLLNIGGASSLLMILLTEI